MIISICETLRRKYIRKNVHFYNTMGFREVVWSEYRVCNMTSFLLQNQFIAGLVKLDWMH